MGKARGHGQSCWGWKFSPPGGSSSFLLLSDAVLSSPGLWAVERSPHRGLWSTHPIHCSWSTTEAERTERLCWKSDLDRVKCIIKNVLKGRGWRLCISVPALSAETLSAVAAVWGFWAWAPLLSFSPPSVTAPSPARPSGHTDQGQRSWQIKVNWSARNPLP